MRTFQHIGPLRTYLRGFREEGKIIGLVPTMGALHEGHISLVRRARSECDVVIVSVFVNPTQFGPGEDLEAYPRDMNRDMQLCAGESVDGLFHPETSEIYPSGYQTFVRVPELSALWEGARRPGHFDGVATVVAKLLNIARPHRAYFGQKDYQQVLLVERLVRDLNFSTTIVMAPTVREPDGLALSSRNAYLNPAERQAASVLYRSLQRAEMRLLEGVTDPAALQQELESLIASEPLAILDYVALAHPETLQPVASLGEEPTLVAVAARIGRTRLIDNCIVAPQGISPARIRTGKSSAS